MNLRNQAETAVHECLELESDESVVVVTDEETEEIGEALYQVASEVTEESSIIKYPSRQNHGQEPVVGVADVMESVDAFLAPTSKSITHTRAVSNAVDNDTRGATLPGITKEAFKTGLNADYNEIADECERLAGILEGSSEMRIITDKGTDVTFSLREWHPSTGDVSEPGTYSNLPDGEIFTAPKDANGTIVYDGTMRPHGLLGSPITVEVEDGYVTSISDDGLREIVENAAEEVGQNAYNVAEAAIGANTGIKDLTGNVLLDEKAAGTVHVAIGDNLNFGGDVEAPIHEDGVIKDPTVYVDGEEIDIPQPDN